MTTDDDAKTRATSSSNKSTLKRKRVGVTSCATKYTTPEERDSICKELEDEIEGLFRYYKEMLEVKVDGMVIDGMSVNGMIACLMEESVLPLSKVVEYVFGKMKECGGVGVSIGSVKSSVVLLGQRIAYGVLNEDADVLEDESDECLWCWETRDLKMLPRAARMMLKVRRTCRKKIHERITAVSGFLSALRNLEKDLSTKSDLMRRSEKLCKVLNEADIRLLADSMMRKNDTEMSQKDTKKEEKLIVKQLEKNKREHEKEKKKIDRELLKEKLLHEKEQKRLQEDAERRREKEENEFKKQQKRLQEETEREQRQREKEEVELKKQIALKKQASLMERFVMKKRTDCISEIVKSSASASIISNQQNPKPVIQSMDDALAQRTNISASNLQMSHMASWRKLGESIRTNKKQCWGVRRKPKTELVKEIKLSSCKEMAAGNDQTDTQLLNRFEDFEAEGKIDVDAFKLERGNHKGHQRKQLLQFDKSFRPAFYGVWPKKSNIIGPRRPFKKDPDLDYAVDSDEEWEEEEPGESLSDCEKDEDDESLEDGIGKAEEEDESEDGFFVPDGYLSDNEGVQDRMESGISAEDVSSGCQLEEPEELRVLMKHQKYLKNLTDQVLCKNQPLFISNLMHEKAPLFNACNLSGIHKVEQMCLQALSMCLFPGHSQIEISIGDEIPKDNEESCSPNSKTNVTPKPVSSEISDVDLPKFVSAIQYGSQGISKIIEGLQPSFPSVSKSILKAKVRQLSEFVDNRWQVKREVLDDLGLAPSPSIKATAETPPTTKGSIKKKNITITTFFLKRCMPPSETKTTNINPNEVSPEPPKKIARNAYFEPQVCRLSTADEPKTP